QAHPLHGPSVDPRRPAAHSLLLLMGPRSRSTGRPGTETEKELVRPDPIEADWRHETARDRLAADHRLCSSAICSLVTRMEDRPVCPREPTSAYGTGPTRKPA